MARRSMTLKRIDPWSVLKFSLLANLVFLGILLLAGRVAWFVITRLELIDKVCEVAESVGFTDCGVNGGAVFQNALLLGILAVVVQTGIFVFLAFLHNLLAELTGGITVTLDDPNAPTSSGSGRRASGGSGQDRAREPRREPASAGPTAGTGAASGTAGTAATSSSGGATASGATSRATSAGQAPPAGGAAPGKDGETDLFPHRRRLHGPERP